MKKTIFTLFLMAIFALGTMNVINAASDCDVVFDFESNHSANLAYSMVKANGDAGAGAGAGAISVTASPTGTGNALYATCGGYDNAQYVRLSVTLPVGTTLADYSSNFAFKAYYPANLNNNKDVKYSINNGNKEQLQRVNGGTVWWNHTISLSTLPATTTAFTVEIGCRDFNNLSFYIDSISLPFTGTCGPPKLKPVIAVNPTLGSIDCGETLADVTISGGTVTYTAEALPPVTVVGTFAFDKPATKLQFADNGKSYKLVFTPTDAATYDTVSVKLPVTVIDNGNCDPCNTSAGFYMIDCFEDKDLETSYNMQGGGTALVKVKATSSNANNRAILVSPANWDQYLKITVTLPSGKTISDYTDISFDIIRGGGNNNDFLIGFNKTLGNSTYDIKSNFSTTTTSWLLSKSFSIPSSISTSNTFVLSMGYRGSSSDTYYLDNIQLKEVIKEPTSVSEQTAPVVYIYENCMNINKLAQKIHVFNVDGRMILSAENCSTLNISSLSSGVYIAKIITDNQTKIIKFAR